MSPDAIFGAAYTLLGAVAGALIAFIPMTIMGVMTRLSDDQRTAILVSKELEQLQTHASEILSFDSPSTKIFSPTPKAAWAYALGRPSFILSLSNQTFEQLSAISAAADILEDGFSRVRLSNSMMSASPNFGGQHSTTKDGLNTMLRDSADLIMNSIDEADMKLEVLSAFRRDLEMKLIRWRMAIAGLIVLAVLALVVGGFLLHLSGATS